MNPFDAAIPPRAALLPIRALYAHVPFCRTRCSYCDFHSHAIPEISGIADSYISAIESRAKYFADRVPMDVLTMYLGGGTPTLLSEPQLERILKIMKSMCGEVEEWTVEANPESFSAPKAGILRHQGVTRVSLGIQSMDEAALRVLGRACTPEENSRALRLALESGLDVSADLIAGIPIPNAGGGRNAGGVGRAGENVRQGRLSSDLRYLLTLGVPHISIYDLTLEEGTALWKRVSSGELKAADPDLVQDEREKAEELLAAEGYARYEISNYAMPGKESKHNGLYWEMASYLGLGSGAVSTFHELKQDARPFDPKRVVSWRIEEGKSIEKYLDSAAQQARIESINALDAAFETVMMGLRTSRGLDLAAFKRRFGVDLRLLASRSLAKYEASLKMVSGRLALDPGRFDTLNPILVDFLGEMSDPASAATKGSALSGALS